jgi:3'-phosphoadenosine 5'-phosphosulfate sulfotransferase (PAPS reductase)/FAD synthetase
MIKLYPSLETTPLIEDLLANGSPVAIGVSGGKDSDVTAFETMRYLDSVGHNGSRILIHSDLGRVEWRESLPQCERLAQRLDLELVVVRRQAGDLMDRWLVRWQHNCERYVHLECVKMILPWSTPSMRFCTSELKTAVISRDLVERFPGQTIISVAGLRRDESPSRAKAPIVAAQAKLTNKTFNTTGYSWYPILAWSKQQVFDYHQEKGFPLHPAYTQWGTTRVSCCYCILGSLHDLIAAAKHPDNQDIYREMVMLEINSAFSFQDHQWLGDIASHLLSEEQLAGVRDAKRRAAQREQIERRIPAHLLYTKGWPTLIPTRAEAVLLSEVRRSVADIMQISIEYSEPDAILERYAELMAMRVQRGGALQPVPIQSVQHQLWDREGAE